MTRANIHYLAVPLLAALFSVSSVYAQTPAAEAGATTQTTAKLAKGDQRYLEQLAQGNLAEIAAGKMALEKSQNAQVTAFAQKMVDEHGKGLQEVQAVAQSKGVTLPTEPDAKQTAMAAKLDKLSGDAFDRAYLAQAGVKAHKDTHALVRKVQAGAKDPDVKALGAKLEPTVAAHLASVTELNASVRAGGNTRMAGAEARSEAEASGTGAAGATGSGTGTAASPGTKAPVKPDPASGNTDNPLNKQNPTSNAGKQQ